MPSIGEYQAPAGKNISPALKPLGKRTMSSRNSTIKSSLSKAISYANKDKTRGHGL